jgi:hypothetical protein
MGKTEIVMGRQQAVVDGDFVVFLIGARVNKKRHLRRALRAINKMQPMLRYLEAHPEKGLLGYESAGLTFIQYWRSFDDLERFARNTDDPHLDAWRQFSKLQNGRADAGIWHETFLVRAGEYEAIYQNMPRRGLGKVGELKPLQGRSDTARGRLGRDGA